MDLQALVTALNLKIHTGHDKLSRPVAGGYASDLLSDVIANSSENHVWITRQVHQNIVAVASLKDLAGIILIKGAEPPPETLEKAQREGIPILGTEMNAFELSGKVYQLLAPKG